MFGGDSKRPEAERGKFNSAFSAPVLKNESWFENRNKNQAREMINYQTT